MCRTMRPLDVFFLRRNSLYSKSANERRDFYEVISMPIFAWKYLQNLVVV